MARKKAGTLTIFENMVYVATARIPAGRVSTYGQIARAIQKPKSSRAVGNALNANPFSPASTRGDDRSSTRGWPVVPCHRVVRSNGEVGDYAGGQRKKIRLLRREGIGIIKVGKSYRIKQLKKVLMKF